MMQPLLSLNQHIATLEFGHIKIIANAQHGARITSFSYDDQELLTQSHDHPENFGSTLWDAPQSRWHWPPPCTLDSEPYTIHLDALRLTLISNVDKASGLQFTKQISPLLGQAGVIIEYSIKNTSNQAITTAAWEITRAPGGITFVPAAQLTPTANSDLPDLKIIGDFAWYTIDPAPLSIGKKAFLDVYAGWLAHVTPNRLLFVKSFTPLTSDRYSSGHAAVEVYAHIDGAYVELENHGPRTLLEPGDSLSYAVRWFLQPIPDHIAVVSGNQELVHFAQEILNDEKS